MVSGSARLSLVARSGALIQAVALLGGAQITLPQTAYAQGATVTLEEIIVTARRREEDLFEAPLSITTLTAADLENAQIDDIGQLSQFTPGFYYTAQASFSSARVTPGFRFRGMNNGSNDPLVQQGGIFIDGVFLFGGAQSQTFEDIERVEVIKGPQSALFGRSTFAGAVNFITKKPSDHFATSGTASVATHGSYDFAVSAESPLVGDQLSARISVAQNKKGGQFTTTDGGKLGEEQTKVVNGQLVWKPTDALQIRVRQSLNWQDDSRNAVVNMNSNNPIIGNSPAKCRTGTQFFWCGAIPVLGSEGVPPLIASVATKLPAPAWRVTNNPSLIQDILSNNRSNPLVRLGLPLFDQVPRLDHAGLAGKFSRTSVETDYVFANEMSVGASFVSSSMRAMSAESTSGDGGNGWVVSPNILRNTAADFRLSSDQKTRFSWSVGGNYYLQSSLGGPQGTGPVASTLDFNRSITYLEPATFTGQGRNLYHGVYFALHYDILNQLAVDFEGRYQRDRVTTSYQLVSQTTSKFTNFVPRAILTFKPNDGTTIYASWAKGVLPGTTNSNTVLLSPALQAQIRAFPGYAVNVPTETVQNFELGAKQQYETWRYALTGYYMKWDNLKNVVNLPCPGGVCGPTVFTGFAPTILPQTAKVYGMEAEVGVLLTDNWDAKLTFDFVHARYDRFLAVLAAAATGQTDASGKTIYGFPGKQGALTTSYHGDIDGSWEWYTRGDLTYTGRIYVDELNQSWLGDRITLNLRAGVENDQYRIEFFVNNALNDKHWISGIRNTQSNYSLGPANVTQASAAVVLPELRSFGARVKVNFN